MGIAVDCRVHDFRRDERSRERNGAKKMARIPAVHRLAHLQMATGSSWKPSQDGNKTVLVFGN